MSYNNEDTFPTNKIISQASIVNDNNIHDSESESSIENEEGSSSRIISKDEIEVIKSKLQSQFDVHPNLSLPVLVEYSLGIVSEQADNGCTKLQSDVEELYLLSDEIISKSSECNLLISKLNDNTVRVSKKLKQTHQSIRTIKLPRKSILLALMLALLWFFSLLKHFIKQIINKSKFPNNSKKEKNNKEF